MCGNLCLCAWEEPERFCGVSSHPAPLLGFLALNSVNQASAASTPICRALLQAQYSQHIYSGEVSLQTIQ